MSRSQFSYTRDQLMALSRIVIEHAAKQGATAADTEISEGVGQRVSVRQGEIETIEYNKDKGAGVTVYLGERYLYFLLNLMCTWRLVCERRGHGANMVTGDYSRGAAGFWVENGEIQYPVEEITIAGNLAGMFKGIVAIGRDVERRGSKQVGSILIDHMTVAGN